MSNIVDLKDYKKRKTREKIQKESLDIFLVVTIIIGVLFSFGICLMLLRF